MKSIATSSLKRCLPFDAFHSVLQNEINQKGKGLVFSEPAKHSTENPMLFLLGYLKLSILHRIFVLTNKPSSQHSTRKVPPVSLNQDFVMRAKAIYFCKANALPALNASTFWLTIFSPFSLNIVSIPFMIMSSWMAIKGEAAPSITIFEALGLPLSRAI